jgi:hypothetical protein
MIDGLRAEIAQLELEAGHLKAAQGSRTGS